MLDNPEMTRPLELGIKVVGYRISIHKLIILPVRPLPLKSKLSYEGSFHHK